MGKALGRLGGWIFSHAKSTITIVLAITALVIGVAIHQGADFAGASLNLPNSQSQKAMSVMNKEFSQTDSSKGTIKIVFHSENGQDLTSTDNQNKIQELLNQVQGQEHVTSVVTPETAYSYSADKKTAYASVNYDQKSEDVSATEINRVKKQLAITRDAKIQTELSGNVTFSTVEQSETTEGVGIIVAYVVLAITFASLLVAGLPILSAVLGLAVSMMIVMLLTNVMSIPSTSSALVGMMGLAVGIDYALFIISRYRQEIALGKERKEAMKAAMSTAGVSVVFAGATVMVAMAAMVVLKIDFLATMGIAAAIGVFFAVLMSLTLVPAILSLLGERVTGQKKNRVLNSFAKFRTKGGFGRFVVKHRIKTLVLAIAALVLIAMPVLHMNLGLPNDGESSLKQTERRAYDMQKAGYGDGVNATLVVLAKTDDAAKASHAGDQIKQLKNVANVTPAMPGKSGKYYLLAVTPKTDANDPKTKKLVTDIRDLSVKKTQASLMVTGATAINVDVTDAIASAIPKFALLIIAFAFILLMMAFRSILIPLVAVAGFGLSLCATLGAVVWIVQDGNMLDFFQIPSKASLLAFMPVLVIGIMFGLAMDYEIFLVSRIREEYNRTKDTTHSVIVGLQENGTVVFAAIVIMASVFAGFIFSPEGIIKSIGLSFTFGVIFDALIVRMIIVPAAIALFGKANWYLPKWLDKIVPQLHVD
ncbi:MMPL family transporter [Fructobacillus fructosus]|uniref:MMPL/SSD domain n=1 Tax=Fructobacillus fructosus TaxID=1631 RepID=A0ABN9YKH5_9LACO|nr:MMPL/SSD domain [Fructobacillus fructosus]